MKLILTNEVSGLGSAGDIVEVKDGYGRNFLLPRGLATPWTRGGQKQVEALRQAREARAVKSLEEAQGLAGQLQARQLVITAQASPTGRLFGSVTQSDVAEAAKAAGVTIDRRTVEFLAPIRTTGEHRALVRLHPEVQATATLSVVAG